MSWESHCDAIAALAGDSYVEACIFNGDGVFYTPNSLNYFHDLTVEKKQELIKNHDTKSHRPFAFRVKVADDTIKFQNVQQTDEFTVFTYSGNIGTLQKPVMVLARTKTAAVLAIFNKRDSNVSHCCKIAENLTNQGI